MLHAGHDRAETQGDDPVHDHSRPDHNTRHEKLLGGGMRGRDDGCCRARRRNVRPQRNQPTMFSEMEDDDDA